MSVKNTIKSSSWFILVLPALAVAVAMVILLSGSNLYAGQESHETAGMNEDHASDSPAQAHGRNGDHDGEEHEMDLGQERAANIAVAEPPEWYRSVVWSIGILFVLAATLGSAAIVLKGPEPPDPADDHAREHGDDHGHH